MTCMLPLERIVHHPANVRKGVVTDVDDLAASITSVGILQPLVVFRAPAKPGTYVVLAGHRRLAAARMLGLREVPCVVRDDAATINEQTVIMLVENLQRSDLGPVEKAEAFGALRDRGLSANQIARRVGLSQGAISYFLTLLDLDDHTLEDVRNGRVQVTHAIEAVRSTRATQRKRTGSAQPGRPTTVEPAYFTHRHRLAAEWSRRCHHTPRPRIAGACGQCIEAVIRADERLAIASEPSTEGITA